MLQTKRGNAAGARAAFTRAVKRGGGGKSAVTLQVDATDPHYKRAT